MVKNDRSTHVDDSDEEWEKRLKSREADVEMGQDSEDDESEMLALKLPSVSLADKVQEPVVPLLDAPCARFNAMMTVQKGVLYLFGGILEQKDREITLNDFWSLNLDKLSEWTQLLADDHLTAEWFGEASDNESETDDEDGDEGSDDEEGSSDNSDNGGDTSSRPMEVDAVESPPPDDDASSEEEAAAQKLECTVPDPLPGEALHTYFSRTAIAWQVYAQDSEASFATGKALRRDAFEMAQERFAELLPQNEEIARQMVEHEAKIRDAAKKEVEDRLNSRHRR